jgi:hypothetical protein
MNFPITIATRIIFILTYAGVSLGRVPGFRLDRAGIALTGAALMMAVGATIRYFAWRHTSSFLRNACARRQIGCTKSGKQLSASRTSAAAVRFERVKASPHRSSSALCDDAGVVLKKFGGHMRRRADPAGAKIDLTRGRLAQPSGSRPEISVLGHVVAEFTG